MKYLCKCVRRGWFQHFQQVFWVNCNWKLRCFSQDGYRRSHSFNPLVWNLPVSHRFCQILVDLSTKVTYEVATRQSLRLAISEHSIFRWLVNHKLSLYVWCIELQSIFTADHSQVNNLWCEKLPRYSCRVNIDVLWEQSECYVQWKNCKAAHFTLCNRLRMLLLV